MHPGATKRAQSEMLEAQLSANEEKIIEQGYVMCDMLEAQLFNIPTRNEPGHYAHCAEMEPDSAPGATHE